MIAGLLLATLSQPAHAGWTVTAQENDCTFYAGEAIDQVVPVRAVCDWPIAPARVHTLLGQQSEHHRVFSAVKESTVVKVLSGGVNLVRMVYQATGISDRESMVGYRIQDIDGGRRYSWSMEGVVQERKHGLLVPSINTGMWEVVGNATGGSRVTYEGRFQPGGNVPGFVVNWFQGSGIRGVVGDLRTYLESAEG